MNRNNCKAGLGKRRRTELFDRRLTNLSNPNSSPSWASHFNGASNHFNICCHFNMDLVAHLINQCSRNLVANRLVLEGLAKRFLANLYKNAAVAKPALDPIRACG